MSVVDVIGKEGSIVLVLILYLILIILSVYLHRRLFEFLFSQPDMSEGTMGAGGMKSPRFLSRVFLLLTHLFLILTISFVGGDTFFSDDSLSLLALFFMILSLSVFLIYLLLVVALVWEKWWRPIKRKTR